MNDSRIQISPWMRDVCSFLGDLFGIFVDQELGFWRSWISVYVELRKVYTHPKLNSTAREQFPSQ